MDTACPCGSGAAYADCCQRLHLARDRQPIRYSPEQLMRSRYTAFCQHNADYLVASLHPSRHADGDREQLLAAFGSQTWLSLAIVEAPPPSATEGMVEFVAFFQSNGNNGEVRQLHERSRFVFEQNQWWYVTGDILPDLRLGRNDPCWCGSGRKLKKCHNDGRP